MSDETTERVHRGAADPVYRDFSAFLQLCVHRACTRLLESASTRCGREDTDTGAEHYDALMQCEVTRRGIVKDLTETWRPYWP